MYIYPQDAMCIIHNVCQTEDQQQKPGFHAAHRKVNKYCILQFAIAIRNETMDTLLIIRLN